MRIVKKNVYYCDFCEKKSLVSLKRHEKHCTGNPDRECAICGRKHSIRSIIAQFAPKVKYHTEGEEEFFTIIADECPTLDEVKAAVEGSAMAQGLSDDAIGCPACVLAVLRGIGVLQPWFHDLFKYDRKKEFDAYWRERNFSESQGIY